MLSPKIQNVVEDKCSINLIPQSVNASTRLLSIKLSKNISNVASNNDIKKKDFEIKNAKLLHKIIFLKKYGKKIKSADGSTTTAINSNSEKIKQVTFSTVEIIRIKSVKHYNKLNSFSNIDIRNNKLKAKKEKEKNKDECAIF